MGFKLKIMSGGIFLAIIKESIYSYISENDYNSKNTFPTFEDGHRRTLICDAILKSSDEEIWVSIKEIEDTL